MNDYLNYRYAKVIAHSGIKGQRWGVRRYQNEDGTWTEAGKERYGDDAPDGAYSKKDAKKLNKISKKYDSRIEHLKQQTKLFEKFNKEDTAKLNDLRKNKMNSRTFKKSFEDQMGFSADRASQLERKAHYDWLVDSIDEGIETDIIQRKNMQTELANLERDRDNAMIKAGLKR